MNAKNPIGIFDSGVGGLTVANAVYKRLPNEQIIYYGDTAHLPYGDKSPETIKGYANQIADFLLEKECKMIVIACNTASAHAYETLKEKIDGAIPLVNVIDPVVEWTANKDYQKVGIIGTRATVLSGLYETKLAKAAPELETVSTATPLLAPYIEEGFYKKKVLTSLVLEQYLGNDALDKIDALILACTHYPIIVEEIGQYYGGRVELIDSTSIVANYVATVLEEKDLLGNSNEISEPSFYVSDYTKSFESMVNIFFGAPIKLSQHRL